MDELLVIGGVKVEVVTKTIRNLHLTVHPPDGRVRIAAPERMARDAIRLFAISKLPWIRRQQDAMRAQERETPREYLDRESHYVWGKRYLLRIVERAAAPSVELEHSAIVLNVRADTDVDRRREVLALWYRDQLRAAVAPRMTQWAETLGVRARRLFVQHMKTKWGSCNPTTGSIRLNTELAKKPPECMEYVLVHELAHLIESSHNERFRAILDRHLPGWEQLRDALNRAPLAHEDWDY